LRTDSLMAGPLKMAQLVSLMGIIFGAVGLWWFSKRENSQRVSLREK
jgi:prolipoprotein diacylglyceryltransferase